ncbi:hydantoinase B/oxoprolinase family protein [Tengunoibacter tsumagoiensis]|uniref:5-oxoprolinase n=1 Tax=Tengunoibacter tsumagoiensis TaxID=2014871 RepID=A0A401ZY34_9CHLR|nr:hydantoinase B/oxoprolinase family protein [Tengunoibacter tsumagoiensis]GCE11757.1 5-oxoprolinase [Tengunoibacter tsumagoiensis]
MQDGFELLRMKQGIVGVDIGGTFTDLVHYLPPVGEQLAQLRIYKVPGTPQNPAQGLLNGLQALGAEESSALIHGSTVATNVLLERKGARAVLVTTEGFADVLEIARQDRPALYDIQQQRPPTLIPRGLRLELAERLDYHGNVLKAPDAADFEQLLVQIAACKPESLAICLLYSFRNPEHEQTLAVLLKECFPGLPLSLSSEILPQFREYERTSTVAVNAYVQPVMSSYLQRLQESLLPPLRIMQSSGGSISAATAAKEPVRTVLSGPAGGVIGAFHVAHHAGYDQLLTLDMGGTSTDVALCPGRIPLSTEAVVGGCPVGIQTIAIQTVGAGGGSLVRLDAGNSLTVGPESAGADPGPVCYGRGEELTVTDANLILGRISPEHFLGGRFTLYPERAEEKMDLLARRLGVSREEAALGIVRVANASMERTLRAVSLEQGYDPRLFTLLPFGGAGPLHACELAEELQIPAVFVPRYPGVLSALGMILAPIVKDYVQTVMLTIANLEPEQIEDLFAPLEERACADMEQEQQIFSSATPVTLERFWDLRYPGQSYEITTPDAGDLAATLTSFHSLHQQRFGHSHPEQPVQLVAIRIKASMQPAQPELAREPLSTDPRERALSGTCTLVFARGAYQAPVYQRERLQHGHSLMGPALIVQEDSTFVLPPDWQAEVDAWGNIVAHRSATLAVRSDEKAGQKSGEFDAVTLEIFKHLFASAAEEMGVTLGRSGYSPNIKERKDYSCACFDAQGRLIAQAAHIPVHLGAMPASVRTVLAEFTSFEPGDLIILNDPYRGGTHLPDITMVSPVFIEDDPDGRTGELFGFVASRAHHADIGGISPGSMPMSRELYQEGIIIPPLKLMRRGILNIELLQLFYRNVRTPDERRGDIDAQMAASRVGEQRLQQIIARYGSSVVQQNAEALLSYSAHLMRQMLSQLPEREVTYTDYLDDDGWGNESIPLTIRIVVQHGTMTVDFSGSASQSQGCLNAVQAVTHSSVLYVLRCLAGEHIPANQGCLEAVTIKIPMGSILHPHPPAAVAAGNVETSQRTVDVLFGALAQLAPERIPAASQGTMNNLTMGGQQLETAKLFAYYETMGGGMGARPGQDGLSGVHVHMSNTRNTPVEALEMELPVRIKSYSIREGSGGRGRYRGGDGLCRAITFLAPASVTLLTDRRQYAPYGLHGGQPGARGQNTLEEKGIVTQLPGKLTMDVQPGATLTICTPGGGGFLPEEDSSDVNSGN